MEVERVVDSASSTGKLLGCKLGKDDLSHVFVPYIYIYIIYIGDITAFGFGRVLLKKCPLSPGPLSTAD